MAVDRGGLNYTISVKDQFSKATEKFVTEITRARQAFAAFKTEAAGVAATNAGITVSIDRATASSRRKTAQLSTEAEAERRLTRILRERIVSEKLRELAQQKGVRLTQQKVRQLSIEQEAERKLLQSARSAAVARKVEELALKRSIDLSRRKVTTLTIEQQAQERLARAVQRRAVLAKTEELALAQGIELSKKKVKQLSVEEEALKRVEKAERERAVAARVSAIEQQKFIGPQLPPGFVPPTPGKPQPPADPQTVTGLQKARTLLEQFRTTLGQTNNTGNDLIFTFRRLFGVLAAFQAARLIFRSFIDFIQAGIQFNATIETTRIGIASLIIAVGEVSDEQGNVVEGAEAFLVAQKEAVRQQRLLRNESLKTTATFEELLTTFQTAVGPGIAAGLNLDQIREFSIRISQAASAIGLAQNQLSEEIRSILSGTIQQRTTRIAAVLQITPEDIRQAREAGTLFEFLQERFKTFGIAGDEAAKTFNGLVQILRGSVQEIAGLAAQPLFETLRSTLKELVDLTLTIGPEGAVIINPDAVLAVAPIFAGIQAALISIRETAASVGFGDLQSSAQLIGASIAVAGQVIGGVVQGIIRGFNVVVALLEVVADAFGAQGKSLQEIVSLATKYSVIFGSVLIVVGLVGAAMSAIVTPLRLLIGLVTSLASGVLRVAEGFAKLPAELQKSVRGALILTALFFALGEAMRQVTEAIFGVNLSLRDVVDLVTFGFIVSVFDAITAIEELAFTVKSAITEAFISATEAAASFVQDARIALNQLFGDTAEAVALINKQADEEAANDRARARRRKQAEVELADIRRDNEARSLAFTEEIAGIVGDAAGKDALGQIPGTIEELLGGITSVFGQFDLGLSSFFKDLQSSEGFTFDNFFNLDAFLVKLKKAQEEAAAAAASGATVAPRGIPVTDEQRQELAEAQQKLAITQQEVAAQRELNGLVAQGAGPDQIRLQELKNQSAELFTQLETQRVLNELEVDKAEKAIGGAQGEEQRLALEEQLLLLKQQQIADEELLRTKIGETNLALERQRQIVEGTIGEGFGQGLDNFANQFGSAFQAGINIATELMNGFATFVSDSIVSAFDPNNDTSIKERFGRFLQDLAKTILNELIKLQIAKLLIGFGFGGTSAGASTGGSIGLAEGGSIPRRGRASPAHYGVGVKGLAIGGEATPPPGISRKDTVPIWAQPGEFMQSLAAVRTYGRDFMEALNNRVLDPRALRGMMGLRSTRRLMAGARRGPGFVTGGLISEQVARQTAAQSFVAAQPQGGGVQRAVVVAGESEFDKLVSGGSGSLLRWMKDNRDTVRGIIQR